MCRVACGLDIGSNTFSLCEVERTASGDRVVNDTSLPVRLSEGLQIGGPLKPDAILRGLNTLEGFVETYQLHKKPLKVVATAALRMTSCPEAFTRAASDILGADIEIISGENEALLVSRGALLDIDLAGAGIIVDVGGQSTEVCWSNSARSSWHPVSLDAGVVRLTEEYFHSDPPNPAQIDALKSHLRALMAERIDGSASGTLVGVAGTATTLGFLELELKTWDANRLHGMTMDRDRIQRWLGQMTAVDAAERTNRYGINPGRADVFPAGICVLLSAMEHLNCEEMTISTYGLRVGAALSLLDELSDP